MDTLYVAADDAAALTKYSLVGSTWVARGTVGVDSDNYSGVTGVVNGSSVKLYATRRVSSSSPAAASWFHWSTPRATTARWRARQV